MHKVDLSERDSSAQLSFYVLLKKRYGQKQDLFDNYWSDVHGPVCARLPGQYQYWQFHLDHNKGGLWPQVEGVQYNSNDADQFDGIAELTFTSEKDRDDWFSAAAILMSDEHNIFSRAVGYVTKDGNAKTYVDINENGSPNGLEGGPRFQMTLQKADNASVDAFRSYINESFVPAALESEAVTKLRVHLLEPHDNSDDLPPAAGVDHFEPEEKQYQAAIEIAFKDYLAMETFFASKEYQAAVVGQANFVQRVNAFPVRDIFTFVYDGEMTLSGQRGASTASLIEQIGATNQLQEDITQLMIKGSV